MPDPAPVIRTTLSVKLMAVFSSFDQAIGPARDRRRAGRGRSRGVLFGGRPDRSTGHRVERWVSRMKESGENPPKKSSVSSPEVAGEPDAPAVPNVGEC